MQSQIKLLGAASNQINTNGSLSTHIIQRNPLKKRSGSKKKKEKSTAPKNYIETNKA